MNGDLVALESLSVISIANGIIANKRSSVLALPVTLAKVSRKSYPYCRRYNIYTPTTYVSFIL